MGQLLLVRHGQASWGADDYDVLSPVGHDQSAALGSFLRDRGIVADVLLTGAMRRHRETAEQAFPGASQEVDPGWDEFDHVGMLARLPAPFEDRQPTKDEFQAWFERATGRWTDGEHDADYAESFTAFTDRVDTALRRTSERDGTVVVVSSGGPISWTVAALVGADLDAVSRVALWRRLNPVCVNSGVTRLVTGRRGTTLVTFNEHAHLDATDLLTYR